MVTVATLALQSGAEELRKRFEQAGIRAMVRHGGEETVGHTVEVDSEQFLEAMILLGELDLLDLSPWEAIPCPTCGSLKTESVKTYYHDMPLMLLLLSFFLLGLPLLLRRPRLRCFDCGTVWPRPRGA